MAIFGGIAVTAVICGVILLMFANTLVKWMHGAEQGTPSNAEQVEEQQAQLV
ncbi:di-/tripeptide transporter [Vibrio variabilis]|uniref:Di-/tripeptide transporter n=1 Tax=Vibrio variabilis TaxID=990271 RepID=A0ABQ0JMX7_9VIBR|nr:di-/tripeptide transporter [Vibrio variabilis]